MADGKPKYHSDTWRENDDVTVDAKRVKPYGYDSDNLVWRPIRVNSDGELITGASVIKQSETFGGGDKDAIVNNLIVDGWYPKNDIKITHISIFTDKAPTGADLIVDQTVNGVAQSKPATLPDGSQYKETNPSDLTVLTTDRYGLKITQIGSTIPGSGLKVTIFYEKV